MAHFRYEKANGIARITLSRPDKHNAFDEALIAGLTETLSIVEADAEISVLLLAAEGRSFSAGADLDWMRRAALQDRETNYQDARQLAGLMRKLDGLSKTTLALVQGAAYGGGVGLVAACDIAVAAEEARFSLPEVRLGLIPSAIGPFVVSAIGPRHARRYFQTAETFSAGEALRIGLVHEVTSADNLQARGEEIAMTLLGTAPAARAAAKQLIADVVGRPITDALSDMTAARIADIRAGAEAREGLDAFFAKRQAVWAWRDAE